MNATFAIPDVFPSFSGIEQDFYAINLTNGQEIGHCETYSLLEIVQLKWEGHEFVWTFAFGLN